MELLILFACAVGIIYKLLTVLGTENEQDINRMRNKAKSMDYPLPGDVVNNAAPIIDLDKGEVKEVIVVGDDVSQEIAETIRTIHSVDNGFTQSYFMQGAETVFESVMVAIAKGRMTEVKSLLCSKIYKTLSQHIKNRKENPSYIETTLVSVVKSEITEATFKNNIGQIIVRFTSDQINIERDSQTNKIISGDVEHTVLTHDVWKFSRDMSSKALEWEVVSITRTVPDQEGESIDER